MRGTVNIEISDDVSTLFIILGWSWVFFVFIWNCKLIQRAFGFNVVLSYKDHSYYEFELV